MIGLRRNLLMTVAVVLSVAISLTLLGASLLVQDQVKLTAGDWYGKIEVSIFLCDGNTCDAITPEQQAALQAELEADPLVQTVYYESKEKAYEQFQTQFRNQPEIWESVTADALPASFRVKLKDPEQFQAIQDKLVAYPGVEEILDQSEVLQRLFAVTNVFRVGAILLAVALLVVAMVLIVNTIRVAAFARREQTSIMRLVGASNWYIRLPFVLEGVFAGVIGAVVAWVVLLIAVPQFTGFLKQKIEFTPWIALPEALQVGPLLLATGVLIAATSSFLALRRFLDV